jgi:hypothetical protein
MYSSEQSVYATMDVGSSSYTTTCSFPGVSTCSTLTAGIGGGITCTTAHE